MNGQSAGHGTQRNSLEERAVDPTVLASGGAPVAVSSQTTVLESSAISVSASVPGSLNILLVDDSVMDRELVARMLPPGHRVTQAGTAAQAREALDESIPDVVLLDYRLPDADGTTLLPTFAVHRIPVVMLTGMESAEIVVAALHGGAQDYLVKNQLSEESLDRVIQNAVEKARLQRALDDHQEALARQAAALEVKNREISALASALTLAEQAERRRLSNLLHDHLQQLLFGAKLGLGAIEGSDDAAQRRQRLAEVEKVLDEAIATTRDLAVELTPPVLDREDLEVALRWVASHMGERYGLDVEVDAQADCRVPARELRVLLVQFVRELLFNVVKHADTSRATVRLIEDAGHYAISVIDSGRGFDLRVLELEADGAGIHSPRGFGLSSIRERLDLLGGRLELRSQQGEGTSVTIHAPVSVGRVIPPAQQPDLFRAVV